RYVAGHRWNTVLDGTFIAWITGFFSAGRLLNRAGVLSRGGTSDAATDDKRRLDRAADGANARGLPAIVHRYRPSRRAAHLRRGRGRTSRCRLLRRQAAAAGRGSGPSPKWQLRTVLRLHALRDHAARSWSLHRLRRLLPRADR